MLRHTKRKSTCRLSVSSSSYKSHSSSAYKSAHRTIRRTMYSHVYIRLKTRQFEKPAESLKNRQTVEAAIQSTQPSDQPYEIVSTHSQAYFAAKLPTPVNSIHEIPQPLSTTLSSHKLVDEYAASLLVQDLTNPKQYPTTDLCMDVFKKWAKQLPLNNYESYGFHCLVARAEKGSNSQTMTNYGTTIRDEVNTFLSQEFPTLPSDRSPAMKAKMTQLREEAEKYSKDTNTPYIRPTLNTFPFHLEVTRMNAFWYTSPQNGGAVAKTTTQIHETLTNIYQTTTIENRIGEPVLICKIGEIFLKKGNRAKFLYQLQSNIAFKIQGKAQIIRQQYNYVLVPPQKFQGRPFTDDEVQELRDIVKCIPGVDQIQLAYKTSPTEDGLITTLQYLLGIAAIDSTMSCKIKPYDDLTIFGPRHDYKDIVLEFLKGGLLNVDKRSEQQIELLSKHINNDTNDKRIQKRRLRLIKHITDILNLGIKMDTSLTQPCFYSSKSKLTRQLLDKLNIATSELIGDKSRIYDPGMYQKSLRIQRQQNKLNNIIDIDTDDDNDITVSYDDDDDNGNAMNDNQQVVQVSNWVKPKSGVFFKVDIYQNEAYIGFQSDIIQGVGGQPIGTGNDTHTVVTLLSGGMDSPVAAYTLMKRGMRVILVHFQNANLADEETVQNKIIQLSEHLSKYQISTYLHIVPFSAIQDAIITEVPSPARMLVYRRFMFSIAASIAQQYDAKFLVVGDALGQVASQTPSNLYASYSNAPMPLLSPLVGSNKNEIMDIAKHIGTFDISALPYGDCCSYFLAKHPLTSIKKELLYEYEANVGRTIDGGNEKLIIDAQNASAIYRWFKPAEGMVTLRPMKPVKSYHDDVANKLLQECPMAPTRVADKNKNELDETVQFVGLDDKLTQQQIENMMDPTELAKLKAMNKKRKVVDYEKDFGDASAVELNNDEENIILSTATIDTTKKQRSTTTTSITTTTTSTTMSDSNNSLDEVELDDYNKNSQIVAYLDNASTTRLLPSVNNAVQKFLSGQLYGNASSLHVVGKAADLAVKRATNTILAIINSHQQSEQQQLNVYGIGGDDRLIYTSGGTESNNLAIIGSLKHLVQKSIDNIVLDLGYTPYGMKLPSDQLTYPTNLGQQGHTTKYILGIHLLTSHLEHNAILEPLQALLTTPDSLISNRYGLNIHINIILNMIPNDNVTGMVHIEQLSHLLNERPHIMNNNNIKKNTGIDINNNGDVKIIDTATFISVMHANNEIGTIQPLIEIGQTISKYKKLLIKDIFTNKRENDIDLVNKVIFHSDACQSFGKLHIDVQACQLDLLTLNGHKLHGIKGIGALYVRPNIKLIPLQLGGKHQHNIRSGTLNVPGIVSLHYASLYCYSIPQELNQGNDNEYTTIQKYLQQQYKPNHITQSLHNVLTQHGRELKQKQLQFVWKLKELFPAATINGPLATYFPTSSSQRTMSTTDSNNNNNDITTKLLTLDDINNIESHLYTNIQSISLLPSVISILLDPSSQLDSSGIVKYLSTRGICVSAGSACASNNAEPKPSHVLSNIGLKDEWANGTIRISLSLLTTQRELNNAYDVFKLLAHDLHTTYNKKTQMVDKRGNNGAIEDTKTAQHQRRH